MSIDPVTGQTTALGSLGVGNAGGFTFVRKSTLGVIAGNSSGPQGGLVRLDPATFAGTLIGDGVEPGWLTGIASVDGRVFGSVKTVSGGFVSDLVELDPATGAELSRVPLQEGGETVKISDLAAQPGTGQLYGVGRRGGAPDSLLYRIDVDTGEVASFFGGNFVNDGGLGFGPDGTLYLASSVVAEPRLYTLNPDTGGILTQLNYGPDVGLDGLAVRPSDGALIATRGGFSGGDMIVQIDPATGQTTQIGPTGSGKATDLDFYQCPFVPSSVTVRLGEPANPEAYLPGAQPPVVGTTWTPSVDHGSFAPAAILDFAAVSPVAANVPLPIGTLLCGDPLLGTQVAGVGASFGFPIPLDCKFVGLSLCSQAGSVDALGAIALTNALDLVLGTE